MDTVGTLQEAKRKVEEVGFIKEMFIAYSEEADVQDPNAKAEGYCIMGAVWDRDAFNQSYEYFEEDNELARLVTEVVMEQFRDRLDGIWKGFTSDNSCNRMTIFNDHPDTTKDDVILVLEKAIAKAQETI